MPAYVRRGALLAPALLALCAAVAPAQEQSWEEQLRPLLDRFADGVGGARLDRAANLLQARVRSEPTDALARLELARVELARGNLGASMGAVDATIAALQALRAVREKEHQEAVAARQPGQPELPPLEDLERQSRLEACAVGCLVAHFQLQEQLASLSDEAQKKRFFDDHPDALSQVEARQAALRDAAGDLEAAGEVLRGERRRRQLLLDLPLLGEPPPPLGQSDQEGKPLLLHELRGKVVLVLFWSTELPDAVQAALEADAVVRELGPRGFEVIGVSLDSKPEAFAAFVQEKGLKWRHACSGKGFLSPDARAWGIRAAPSGALIDAGGRVRYVNPFGPDLRLAVLGLLDRRDEGGR